MPSLIKSFNAIEGSAFVLLARLLDPDSGAAKVPADFSAVGFKVYDMTNPAAAVLVVPASAEEGYDGDDLDPADVVLESLNTSSKLNVDTLGFNFRLECDGSYIPDGKRTYQLEVTMTPTVGDAFVMLWQAKTVEVYGD